MSEQHVQVRIRGDSPLLMHAFPATVPENLDKLPPAEQARVHIYTDPKGKIVVPAECVRLTFVNGAVYSKGKGRGSLAKNVAAGLHIEPEYCDLMPQEYVIDSRPVVIPATRGRIVRHRAKWPEWELAFRVAFNDNLLTESQVRRIVEDSGKLVGLLDYRPAKRGPFGRFGIVEWKVK